MYHTRKGQAAIAESNRRREIPLLEKFWSKVSETSGCWEWKGTRDKDGYGMIQTTRGKLKAHRFSYEIHRRVPIPKGILCRHSCDNPPCVNPDHLLVGTVKDNVSDAVVRGRFSGMNSKLSSGQVVLIRKLYFRGEITQRKLGEKFKISQAEIQRIVRFKRWRHVDAK